MGVLCGTPQDGNRMRYWRAGFVTRPRADVGSKAYYWPRIVRPPRNAKADKYREWRVGRRGRIRLMRHSPAAPRAVPRNPDTAPFGAPSPRIGGTEKRSDHGRTPRASRQGPA